MIIEEISISINENVFLFVQNIQGYHWMDPNVHTFTSETLEDVKPQTNKSK